MKTTVIQTEKKQNLEGDALYVTWTGTLSDGSPAPWTCNGWTEADPNLTGRVGITLLQDAQWTDLVDQKCQAPAHLYCVEVW